MCCQYLKKAIAWLFHFSLSFSVLCQWPWSVCPSSTVGSRLLWCYRPKFGLPPNDCKERYVQTWTLDKHRNGMSQMWMLAVKDWEDQIKPLSGGVAAVLLKSDLVTPALTGNVLHYLKRKSNILLINSSFSWVTALVSRISFRKSIFSKSLIFFLISVAQTSYFCKTAFKIKSCRHLVSHISLILAQSLFKLAYKRITPAESLKRYCKDRYVWKPEPVFEILDQLRCWGKMCSVTAYYSSKMSF